MPFERWGSLSVDDHVDTKALVANVLLYDRLVIPEWTEQEDRDERNYWIGKGWDPDLQAKRLEQLGELAVRRPWNRYRRELFRTRMAQIDAEQHDADLEGKQLTRMLLAQEQAVDKPLGVHGVTVIAAFNSSESSKSEFAISEADNHLSAQGFLLSRRLAIPDLPDEVALSKAIELSRNEKFRRRRSYLFDWQLDAINKKWSPQESVERIVELVDDYNSMVQDAAGTVRWKFAFTIFAGALGFLTGGPLGAGAGAALSLIQFAKFERKPAIDAGAAQPVVMFHDVETQLGVTLD
jgi:hypothetical protein